MTDITYQLLKQIQWYKPAELQVIKIPFDRLDCLTDLDRFGIIEDDKICGIDYQFTGTRDGEVSVELRMPESLENFSRLPSVHNRILQHRTLGVLGYSLSTLADMKGGYKKDLNEILVNKSKELLDKYKPTRVVTYFSRGFNLALAYKALETDCEVEVIIAKDATRDTTIPDYWDSESKEMAADLLTTSSVVQIKEESYYKSALRVLKSCGVLLYQGCNNPNRGAFFLRICQSNNKPYLGIEL